MKQHYIQQQNDPSGHLQSYNVTLLRSEIAFDINFFTFKTAKIQFAEVSNDISKEVVIKKDTADWLDRHITSAISKVRAKISFAVQHKSRMASNEILSSDAEFDIPLRFGNDWDGDAQVLCDHIHDFVVSQCIADWSEYSLPNRHTELQYKADDKLDAIHDLACLCKPIPYSSPFEGIISES